MLGQVGDADFRADGGGQPCLDMLGLLGWDLDQMADLTGVDRVIVGNIGDPARGLNRWSSVLSGEPPAAPADGEAEHGHRQKLSDPPERGGGLVGWRLCHGSRFDRSGHGQRDRLVGHVLKRSLSQRVGLHQAFKLGLKRRVLGQRRFNHRGFARVQLAIQKGAEFFGLDPHGSNIPARAICVASALRAR